jgi:hypothetical protein
METKVIEANGPKNPGFSRGLVSVPLAPKRVFCAADTTLNLACGLIGLALSLELRIAGGFAQRPSLTALSKPFGCRFSEARV